MEDERIQTVPLVALHPHPRNAEFFDDADADAFDNLKESIAEVGLLTPLRISKNYTIISGHQRYRACKELGVDYVPCIVDDGLTDDNEMVMQLIVSNFGRMKNDPAKQGKMIEEYEKLMGVRQGSAYQKAEETRFRQKQPDIAKQFGITPQSMREYKRFAHMPPEIQECVKTGKFSMTAAVRFLDALSPDEQLKVLASFPEAIEHITRAELQKRVDELFQTNAEAEQAREAEFAAKEDELNKNLAEAQATRQSAEAEVAVKEARLESLNKQIQMAESKLADKRDELAEVQAEIESHEYEEKPSEPEVVPPADYEDTKNELRKAEIEIIELRNELADALKEVANAKAAMRQKKQEVEQQEPVSPAPTPVAADNETTEEKAQRHRMAFQQCFAQLDPYLNNVVGDSSILNQGLSNECRLQFGRRVKEVMIKLNDVLKNLEVD